MRILQLRAERWDQDKAHLAMLEEGVNGALGRNQIMQATGTAVNEKTWQLMTLQKLFMAQANMQAVDAAHRINDKAAEEAQERAFLRNFDRPVTKVAFTDVGLADYGSSPLQQQ